MDAENAGPEIKFTPENAARILAEIISETGFTLSAALKSATSIAIFEPNGLEIQLEAIYDFHRRVIEQPESRSAIQSIVARLTGIDPVVSLRIAAEAPSVQQPKPPKAAEPKPVEAVKDVSAKVRGPSPLRIREDVDPEQDAFVQQVVATFGARVVRVTDAPVRRHSQDEEV